MSILLKGGKIFDGENLIEGKGVLIEDGKISAVAPIGDFTAFDGEVIDTTGGTVMPGLIDCHVHLCLGAEADPRSAQDKLIPGQLVMRALERAQLSLAGGITALRDCGGKDYLEFAVRDACNSGQQMGPSIRASGKVICMTGGHGNANGRIADGVDEVVRAVREQIHAGSDLIKIMATGGVMTPGVNPEDAHYTAEEMRAGIQEGKRFHKRSASHAQGTEGILNAVRGGITSVEHGIYMNDDCVKEMIDAGTYLVPTCAALNNILMGADKGIPAYAVEKTRRVAEFHRRSITMFYEAGGKIAMGTDAGTPFNKHGENAMELKFMVENGIKPIDALKFGTSNAADLVGLDDEGHIRAGANADLIWVDGDPVADINMAADKQNHKMVMKRGLVVNREVMGSQASPFQSIAAF